MTLAARIKAPPISWDGVAPLLLFAAGWAALYAPVYVEFAAREWLRDENAHQPFILAIAAATAWSTIRRDDFRCAAARPAHAAGLMILALGLFVFFVGRINEATLLVSASQGLVALGAAIALFGFSGALRLWFPLALAFYLVVWPGWALDELTAPLKRAVSFAASEALFAAGLPVAHSGAVIVAGPYQLLVADACSGLNSLIALTATGAVYLYVVRRRSVLANAAVLLLLAPIAVFANFVRIVLLVLVTYRFGYDAGQSFLHEAAGLLMFAVALGLVFVVDAAAAALLGRRP